MSKMAIYATLDKVGGSIENVWGYEMRVRTIDSSDKKEVEKSRSDGWKNLALLVIEQIKTEELEAENTAIKGQLAIGVPPHSRVSELEEQLATALSEIAGFETERADANTVIDGKIARISELEMQLADSLVESAKFESDAKHAKDKLAIYELSKDKNGDGKVSYEEMTNAELQALLDERKVDYNKRDGKDVLIQKLKDSE